jgi:predicted acylesterase/phospholipase RssA
MARPASRSGKIAVVCGGGGVIGGVYEVGALRALDQALGGSVVTELDTYVGTSAGALFATALAAGLAPHDLDQIIVQGSRNRRGVPPLRRTSIYGIDVSAWIGACARMPGHLAASFLRSLLPGETSRPTDALFAALQALPPGFFTNDPLQRYVAEVLDAVGAPETFHGYRKELLITAVNVDTGHRVVFGETGTEDVPIPVAVQASAALPILFRPVRYHDQDFVDGGIERNVPVDVAIQAGASLVIALNPLVPVVNDPRSAPLEGWTYLSDRGISAVVDQTFRMLVRSQTVYALQAMRERYPEVDLVFFEPEGHDATMFQWNPMRYSVRKIAAEHGYRMTCDGMRRDAQSLQAIFARHGLDFDVKRLGQPERKREPKGAEKWLRRAEAVPGLRNWLRARPQEPAPF